MNSKYPKHFSDSCGSGIRTGGTDHLYPHLHPGRRLFPAGSGRFTRLTIIRSRQTPGRLSEFRIGLPCLLLLLCLITGCATEETVVEIPLHRDEMKNITTVAILTPVARPDIFVNATTDDQFLMMLFGGPAILGQIMMQAAMIDARKEDSRIFNELTFDTHVGRMLRDSLFTQLKRQAPFHIIPPEAVEDNMKVYKLQDKRDKTLEDYQTIGKQLGADTIIELYVLSCGIKDPGVLSRPHTLLIAKVAMTRARDKKILWQTKLGQAIPQEKKFGFDYEKYEAENAKQLKDELDTLSNILAGEIIEAMGFKAQIPTAELLNTDHTDDAGRYHRK